MASDLTRVTLMYSRRVDDERSASVKIGYAWGTENSTENVSEYRFTVAYRNPI
jgi:hypothetical protein